MSSSNDRPSFGNNPHEPPANDAGAGKSTDRFPPFNDPAFSAEAPEPVVPPDAPPLPDLPPKDTQYEGHPDFSQDAAQNRPPRQTRDHQEPGYTTDTKRDG